MPKVRINDLKIYYNIKGTGEPLILLHGNSGSQKSFRFVIEELSKHFQVYAIDSRWQGKTSKGKMPLTYRQMTDDTAGFIAYFNIKNPNFIGYSDGGIVALDYAARFSGNVGKIITLGANWDVSGTGKEFNAWCEGFLKKLKRLKKFLPFLNKPYSVVKIMLDELAYPEKDLIKNITAPVLLMVGDRDVIPPEHTDWLNSQITASQKAVIKDCGHSIMKEQPEMFLKEALTFLTKI